MRIEKFGVYIADLSPSYGTEPGKKRPVVVVQTDLLNGIHPSTIICPISTKVAPKAEILRIHIELKAAGLKRASDILVDQLRSIDNRRFLEQRGILSMKNRGQLLEALKILVLE
jgi:mRNA interferase MazF